MNGIIKEIILKLVSNAVAKIGGPLGWLARFAVKPITNLVLEYISRVREWYKRLGTKKKDEANEQEYNSKLQDGVKESELDRATDDLLNGK